MSINYGLNITHFIIHNGQKTIIASKHTYKKLLILNINKIIYNR